MAAEWPPRKFPRLFHHGNVSWCSPRSRRFWKHSTPHFVLEGFGISVHHKRATADYRLGTGCYIHHQKPGVTASRYLNPPCCLAFKPVKAIRP